MQRASSNLTKRSNSWGKLCNKRARKCVTGWFAFALYIPSIWSTGALGSTCVCGEVAFFPTWYSIVVEVIVSQAVVVIGGFAVVDGDFLVLLVGDCSGFSNICRQTSFQSAKQKLTLQERYFIINNTMRLKLLTSALRACVTETSWRLPAKLGGEITFWQIRPQLYIGKDPELLEVPSKNYNSMRRIRLRNWKYFQFAIHRRKVPVHRILQSIHFAPDTTIQSIKKRFSSNQICSD